MTACQTQMELLVRNYREPYTAHDKISPTGQKNDTLDCDLHEKEVQLAHTMGADKMESEAFMSVKLEVEQERANSTITEGYEAEIKCLREEVCLLLRPYYGMILICLQLEFERLKASAAHTAYELQASVSRRLEKNAAKLRKTAEERATERDTAKRAEQDQVARYEIASKLIRELKSQAQRLRSQVSPYKSNETDI